MKKSGKYTDKLAELKLVSGELNTMLEDGSFYRLSFANRYAWIRKVKKLYNSLRGPITDFNLKSLLAAWAVSAAAMLAAGCPAPDGGSGSVVPITPAFAAAVTNTFGLTDVGINASPCFVDIDNDGDLDAFIGERFGSTLFFQNMVSASLPSFAAPVTNPFGLASVGGKAYPCFADIDHDGDLDAFIGDFSGDTFYFQNTGSASAPAFAAAVTNPAGLADVGLRASPYFADIDHDGDLDAFIGNYIHSTLYFQNTGSATVPAFAAPVTDPFGLTDVGFYLSPCFADIDNDGDLDAFIGNYYGNVFFFQNTGSATVPAFAAPVTNPFGLTDVGFYLSPCFADIDNDGDLDAFIGEFNGNTFFFQNTAL